MTGDRRARRAARCRAAVRLRGTLRQVARSLARRDRAWAHRGRRRGAGHPAAACRAGAAAVRAAPRRQRRRPGAALGELLRRDPGRERRDRPSRLRELSAVRARARAVAAAATVDAAEGCDGASRHRRARRRSCPNFRSPTVPSRGSRGGACPASRSRCWRCSIDAMWPTRKATDIAFWQNLCAALCLLPFAWASPWALGDIGATRNRAADRAGLVCTALAHTLFIAALRRVSAHTASVVAALEPVYGIVLALVAAGRGARPADHRRRCADRRCRDRRARRVSDAVASRLSCRVGHPMQIGHHRTRPDGRAIARRFTARRRPRRRLRREPCDGAKRSPAEGVLDCRRLDRRAGQALVAAARRVAACSCRARRPSSPSRTSGRSSRAAT